MAVGPMTMHGGLRPPTFALHLGGCAGEHVDIHGVPHDRPRTVSLAASVQREHRAHGAGGRVVGIRRRDIGRAHGGGRGGLRHGLRGGHHHRRRGLVRVGTQGGHMVRFVAPPRVGVVVNPRVAGQFVRPTEAFGTAGKHASMWLFPRMGSNMSGLMFQSMKGLITQRTFVRSREILPSVVGDAIQQRWDPAHHGHRIGVFVVLNAVAVLVVVMMVVVVMKMAVIARVALVILVVVMILFDVRKGREIGSIEKVQGRWRSLHVTRRLQGFDDGSGNARNGSSWWDGGRGWLGWAELNSPTKFDLSSEETVDVKTLGDSR